MTPCVEPSAKAFGAAVTGVEGMEPEEGMTLLGDLYRWQTQHAIQYRHKWMAGTLLMWDNRALLHMATGGCPGHARLLHRTMIGETNAPSSRRAPRTADQRNKVPCR